MSNTVVSDEAAPRYVDKLQMRTSTTEIPQRTDKNAFNQLINQRINLSVGWPMKALSTNQGSDTQVIPKKPGKTHWKKTAKTRTKNLIQFQFVTLVVIKDFYVYSF